MLLVDSHGKGDMDKITAATIMSAVTGYLVSASCMRHSGNPNRLMVFAPVAMISLGWGIDHGHGPSGVLVLTFVPLGSAWVGSLLGEHLYPRSDLAAKISTAVLVLSFLLVWAFGFPPAEDG
jgi:hypothetical protein